MDGFAQPPLETPSNRRRLWLVAGVVLVVVLVIVLGWVMWSWLGSDAPENLEQIQDQTEDAIAACANASDPEACIEEKVTTAAEQFGTAELCDRLDGEAYDDCVWQVALAEQEPTLCRSLEDEGSAQTCSDQINLKLALGSGDSSYCDELSDEQEATNCRNTLARSTAASGSCDEGVLGEGYCADLSLLEAAKGARDPALCASITTEVIHTECIDAVGSGDIDKDGLNLTLETRYGTSDQNPDTDGDGLRDGEEVIEHGTDPLNVDTDGDTFSDFVEVSSGYNPLGGE